MSSSRITKALAAPTVVALLGIVICVVADRFGYSNCLFYAVKQYWKRSGYGSWRKSHHGPWPHFAWSADLKEYEAFVPREGQRMDVASPHPLFRGRIKISDKP